MTNASHNQFVDRRTPEQINSGLATQVLYWYDNPHPNMRESKYDVNTSRAGRVRTNAIAITTDGKLLIARTTCFIRDQFNKKLGRRKAEFQLLGRAKAVSVLRLDEGVALPKAAADAYVEVFPDDEMGAKRAFNVGNILEGYREDIRRRADEMMED